MFGYIFPDKPELKVKEFELFRAYYCGLCETIGHNYGQVARLVLNYDIAFLGLFLSAFKSEGETIKLKRCGAHPLNKRAVVLESPALKYASDINIILSYYKLKDDYHDGKAVKAFVPMGLLYGSFRKAEAKNSGIASVIKKRLHELDDIENKKCASVDMAAEPFARLTEEIFAYPPYCGDKDTEKKLRWFGYNIGKWIYVLDAFDDLDDDIKNKNFNPLIYQFCYNNEKVSDFKDRIKENINFTLNFTLSEVGRVFKLLDIKKDREILENIIYGGMYNKTLQILNKRRSGKDEKSL